MLVVADSTLTWVSAIAAALTTPAALVTVLLARQTVTEAQRARKEADAAHADDTRKQAELLDATTAAHAEDMDERLEAFARELVLQRLIQLSRIADLLSDVDVAAREEVRHREQTGNTGPAPPWSRVIAILTHLEVAIRVYETLGSGALTDLYGFAQRSKWIGVDRAAIRNHATSSLARLNSVVDAEAQSLTGLFDVAAMRNARRTAAS